MAKKAPTQLSEIVFGAHSLIEVLSQKKRKVTAIYTTKPVPKIWKLIEPLLPKYPYSFQYVSRDKLTSLTGTTDHQNVFAYVQPFPLRKKFFDPKKQPFLVLLDGIQDPRNMGAIIRSAYCTGTQGIIITQKNSAPLTPTVHKASAGLLERSDVFITSSVQSAVSELKQAGYSLYLATFSGKDATTCDFKSPLCLVIGSEGTGITKTIFNQGTQVTLPQQDTDVSYNASVAAGILLFLISSKIPPRP